MTKGIYKRKEITKKRNSDSQKRIGNKPPVGSHKGFKHSEGTKGILRLKNVGKHLSEITKKKISDTNK